MFELLFKYPGAIFRKGQFVLLGPWSAWILAGAVLAAAACSTGTCAAIAAR